LGSAIGARAQPQRGFAISSKFKNFSGMQDYRWRFHFWALRVLQPLLAKDLPFSGHRAIPSEVSVGMKAMADSPRRSHPNAAIAQQFGVTREDNKILKF
jgi:hypothetical protein